MKKGIYTKVQLVFEIISYVIVIISLIVAIIGVCTLPKEIAVNFEANGEVSGYGSSTGLLLMPIIMLFTNGLISVMMHFLPISMWNMPFKVNPQKAVLVYRSMVSMLIGLEFLDAVFSLVFTGMMYFSFAKFMLVFTFLYVILIFVDIILFCVISYKRNK